MVILEKRDMVREKTLDGKLRARFEFEGTMAERLSYDTKKLQDCDQWFETDTLNLLSWNAEIGDWVGVE